MKPFTRSEIRTGELIGDVLILAAWLGWIVVILVCLVSL